MTEEGVMAPEDNQRLLDFYRHPKYFSDTLQRFVSRIPEERKGREDFLLREIQVV